MYNKLKISFHFTSGGTMAYKLIAIDVDDTLLTNELTIPARVSQAIQKAVDMGIYVVLCTGRTKKGGQRFYDELGLKTLYITSGGAEVYDEQGHALFTRSVDPVVVKQILEYAEQNNIHAQVYIDGDLVYRKKSYYSDLYEQSYGHSGILEPNLLELPQIITPKVLYVIDEGRTAGIKKDVERLFPMVTIKQSKPIYLEFAHPSVNKGEALAFTANHYGIERQDVIAIGDTDIDIPMLEYAGLGVAMSNAAPHVLEAADIICPSNEEGGVADVIEEYILEEAYESQAQNR
jgi:Cof subfamily protein (haloacid dehalogenase superfamily)